MGVTEPDLPRRGEGDTPGDGVGPGRGAAPGGGEHGAGASRLDPGGHGTEPDGEDGETGQARAPWHFKVIVVGTIGYLGWRLYQGIEWLAHHIH